MQIPLDAFQDKVNTLWEKFFAYNQSFIPPNLNGKQHFTYLFKLSAQFCVCYQCKLLSLEHSGQFANRGVIHIVLSTSRQGPVG